MPRYFLNVRDRGVLIEDPEGEEADDLAAIERIARATIDDIFARPETYGEAQRWNGCRFEITDAAGDLVLTISLYDEGDDVAKEYNNVP